jgi:anti-anti-sigma factor
MSMRGNNGESGCMMDVRTLEQEVLFASVPGEPALMSELALLGRNLTHDKHLVLDFSGVEIITSPSIGRLLVLQQAISRGGGRMVLCGVRLITRCILRTAGLEGCFDLAEDRVGALQRLHVSPVARTDVSHGSR